MREETTWEGVIRWLVATLLLLLALTGVLACQDEEITPSTPTPTTELQCPGWCDNPTPSPTLTPEPTPTLTPAPTDTPTPAPPPPPTLAPPPPLSDVEALICSAGWDSVGLCEKALRVAQCESGPDYYAPVSYYHVGTFQIALAYHAGRFAAHGWDIYTDGIDPYKNSVIAFEIWSEQGWEPWPYCGWR